ncbi:hypothetical protein [Streptomyces rhizosphaericus]|uniref:hypothetical protein n=1 Tax=Streptomyces rhizosphaericus TaxID=114699 RepID=UPI001C3FA993|nr:hypothetical protein [Streptomyces cangkringensis]
MNGGPEHPAGHGSAQGIRSAEQTAPSPARRPDGGVTGWRADGMAADRAAADWTAADWTAADWTAADWTAAAAVRPAERTPPGARTGRRGLACAGSAPSPNRAVSP